MLFVFFFLNIYTELNRPITAGLIYCSRVMIIKIVKNGFNHRFKSGYVRQGGGRISGTFNAHESGPLYRKTSSYCSYFCSRVMIKKNGPCLARRSRISDIFNQGFGLYIPRTKGGFYWMNIIEFKLGRGTEPWIRNWPKTRLDIRHI